MVSSEPAKSQPSPSFLLPRLRLVRRDHLQRRSAGALIFVALRVTVMTFVLIAGRARAAIDAWPPASQYLAEHPPLYKGIVRSSRYLTMRDGVKIAIDVNLPKGLKPGEKIPAILHQTRYYRSYDVGWRIRFLTRNWPSLRKVFVPRGYAWIDMDVRGTGASFG